jgi:hypothetical protein
VAGALFGLLALALVSARTFDASLSAAPGVDPAFAVSQAALYTYIVASGAVGGAALGMIGYGVASQANPDQDRYGMGVLATVAAGVGAIAAFAAARAAIGLAGDIEAGVVELSTFRATIVAMVAGAATGLVIGVSVERLAAREAIGFSGAAAPRSAGAFIRDAAAAITLPVAALAVAAAIVFFLSRALLESDETAALLIFGGTAALFLFGAALIASRPPRRGRSGD